VSDILVSDGPLFAVSGETNIIAIYSYDKDGNPVLLNDAYKCILTVRATEDASSFLLRTFGMIETRGYIDSAGKIMPGVITFLLYPSDTKDIASGDYLYDTVVLSKGNWFDFDVDRYKNNLVFTFKEGKIKIDKDWLTVPAGYILLEDNATNYIEINNTGDVSVNTDGWTEGKNKLYKLKTVDGQILSTWPGSVWFSEGTHSELDFYYNEGYVLTSDFDLIYVDDGYITLENNETNYIEVDDDGIVSSNIYNFNSKKHSLYTVTTLNGAITDVIKVDDVDVIIDERSVFIRGDEIVWASKDEFILQSGITKPDEI